MLLFLLALVLLQRSNRFPYSNDDVRLFLNNYIMSGLILTNTYFVNYETVNVILKYTNVWRVNRRDNVHAIFEYDGTICLFAHSKNRLIMFNIT